MAHITVTSATSIFGHRSWAMHCDTCRGTLYQSEWRDAIIAALACAERHERPA